jgi:shikimate kinase
MARADSTRGVFLIGFMGAGKTSVGRALAQRLGWPFEDLDNVIQRSQGKTVAGIFAEAGESGFRSIESQALQELLSAREEERGNWIVALGGGAFAQPQNRAALQQAGAVTVLLEAPLEELRRRCQQDGDGKGRPLALNKDEAEFARLFRERQTAYQLAKVRIDTMNKTVDQVAAEIEQVLATVMQTEVRQ